MKQRRERTRSERGGSGGQREAGKENKIFFVFDDILALRLVVPQWGQRLMRLSLLAINDRNLTEVLMLRVDTFLLRCWWCGYIEIHSSSVAVVGILLGRVKNSRLAALLPKMLHPIL